MTEDEARKKWCPMVRHSDEDNESASNKCGTPFGECVGEGKWNKCIASNCAIWTWDSVPEWTYEKNSFVDVPSTTQGHCGLINK